MSTDRVERTRMENLLILREMDCSRVCGSYWFCAETVGASLEDVAFIIDGDKATFSKIKPISEH